MLNRSELINIMKENEINISRDNINLSIIENVLKSILIKLNSVECISDSRFVIYGRMKILKEELNKNINEKKYIDAYFNISDFLEESRISLNNSPEIVDKNKEYYNENNICKEEKDILMEMINKYLSSINNDNEKNKSVNKQEILKDLCNDLNESIDNFEKSRLEEINADLFTLKYNQRGLGGIIVGDDGSSMVCDSMHPLSYYIEEFKNGLTDNKGSLIFEIFKEIEALPTGIETTIAKVINYNSEVNMIDPLTQGEIFSSVKEICKKNNIILERTEDSFGGLAYYYKFKKINSNEKLNESLKLSNGKYAVDEE